MLVFTEVNPDKGTETDFCNFIYIITIKFTEVNPDKGTETPVFPSPKIPTSNIVYRN